MRILRVHPFLKGPGILLHADEAASLAARLTGMLVREGNQVVVFPYGEGVGTGFSWGLAPGAAARVGPSLEVPGLADAGLLPALAARGSPGRGVRQNWLMGWMSLVALRRTLRGFRPQVIHNHAGPPGFSRALRSLGGQAPPLVLSYASRRAETELRECARIVFDSKAARDRVAGAEELPPELCSVIYSPLPSLFLSGPIPADRERCGIAYMGGPSCRKDVDLLLEAYELDAKVGRVPLYVCGPSGALAQSREHAIAQGLPVTFLGEPQLAELHRLLGQVRLLVQPSPLEGCGPVMAEAISCGTPAVAGSAQVAEMQDLLGAEVGLSLGGRPPSAATLAQALQTALGGEMMSDARREAMARRARQCLSEQRFAQQHVDLYRQLL